MSKILIAVGGTGQEIALSCLRLSHMAGIAMPTVFIMDSDQGAMPGGRIRTRSQEIQHFNNFLKQIHRDDFTVFLKPLADNITERQLDTLQSLFSRARITEPLVQDVLSLLFTREQQQTSIIDGFHGNPTVGAVGVEDYMIQGEFQNRLLSELDVKTRAQEEHFIVLAGSTTGGTGPGVIPALSRKILEWRSRLNPPRIINVSGIVQLQWFQPLRDDNVDWSKDPNVDLIRLQRNSAGMVRQYHADLATLLDRLILVSLPQTIRRVSAGANHQPETLHWLNVLSGWIATELLYNGPSLNNLPAGGLYGYALDDEHSPLTSLAFLQDGTRPRVSLQNALNATRVLAAFGIALEHQMGNLRPDVALPETTYRFLQAIRDTGNDGDQQVKAFLDTAQNLFQMDQTAVQWFRDACASHFRPEDPNSLRDGNDLQNVFTIPPEQVTIDTESAGKLLKKAKVLEQDFVAFLLHEAQARVEENDPQTTAVALYQRLRNIALSQNNGILS